MVEPKRAVEALVAALQAISTPAALQAVETWEQRVAHAKAQPFGEYGGIEVVLNGLKLPQPFLRQHSVQELINAKDVQYLDHILNMVDDPDWGVCVTAVRGLAQYDDPRIVEALARRLREIADLPTAQTTVQAILNTLGKLDSPQAAQVLAEWERRRPTSLN